MAQSQNTTEAHTKSVGVFTWLTAMRRLLPGYFWPIIGFSLISNMLLLVSPLYMLQVYDRILTSGSQDTLIWLTLIAVFLMVIYGSAEAGRRHICALAAEELDEKISNRIFLNFEKDRSAGSRLPDDLRVLSRVKGFLQNQTVLPFFDLPFAPLFLLVMFIIHPIIGIVGLIGGMVLFCVAITAEVSTRKTNKMANALNSKAFLLASGLSRQRSAIVSMGLTKDATQRWRAAKDAVGQHTLKAGERENSFSSLSRAGRQTLQILILGAGGALAITQQVSPGAIVAGSIIMSRALGPIDQLVGNWRTVAGAQSAWNQLTKIIENTSEEAKPFTPLPRPEAQVVVNRMSLILPSMTDPLVRPFSISLSAGQMVAVMGQNGSGKTTLLQTLAGAWEPHAGNVMLGGRDLHSWDSADRGQYIGYVPQNVELLPGTIAQNIARMSEASPQDIFAAAQKANAHEMILKLPHGYDTEIVMPGAQSLSAGQCQLIGLARAFFGQPVFIILDEPTANLDPDKARDVIQSLKDIAASGAIIVTATHDKSLIAATDAVMMIRDGGVLVADTQKYLASQSPRSVITPIHAQATGA